MTDRSWPAGALVVLLCAFIPLALAAQPVGDPSILVPGAPNSAQSVMATTEIPNCMYGEPESVVVDGSVVRATIEAEFYKFGAPTAPCFPSVTFGPLLAGNYTYEVYLRLPDAPSIELWSRQFFVVSAAPAAIPSLSGHNLTLLLLSLAAVGAVATKVRT